MLSLYFEWARMSLSQSVVDGASGWIGGACTLFSVWPPHVTTLATLSAHGDTVHYELLVLNNPQACIDDMVLNFVAIKYDVE